MQTGQVTIGLDGEQALIAASSIWPLHADQADFNLLCDIHAKVAKLPITIQWKWIEGHQDDALNYSQLDPLAQDNVLTDNLAKAFLNHLIHQDYTPKTQRFGDKGWSVTIDGGN
jgi:hypothetical protein